MRAGREAWAYLSGLAVAREGAFFTARGLEDLGALPPEELSSRLARTWFGPVEPLANFDMTARARRRREVQEVLLLAPAPWPVEMALASQAAEDLRQGLSSFPEVSSGDDFTRALGRFALRAGGMAERFSRALAGPYPSPAGSSRLCASLAVDAAELLVVSGLARESGDRELLAWADLSTRAGAGKAALRALHLGVPRESLRFFFRGELSGPDWVDLAADFLRDFDRDSALRLYPDGCGPGREEGFLLEAARRSGGEPFSALRVLAYLLGFLEQERGLRRAAYRSLGWLVAGETMS